MNRILIALCVILLTAFAFWVFASKSDLIGGILKLSEQKIILGRLNHLPTDNGVSFQLPRDKRGWTIHVDEKCDVIVDSDIGVEVFISNTGNEVFSLMLRKMDQNISRSVSLEPGDTQLVFSGNLFEFCKQLERDNLLKDNGDGTFTEWNPLFYLRSSKGHRISSNLMFKAAEELAFEQPLTFYAYIPADSL
jgi:hypothetical protein